MELKDQVCSLELAKRLKGLGVEQKSAFYWAIGGKATTTPWSTVVYGKDRESNMLINDCAAFTVAELGEMLPMFFQDGYGLKMNRFHSGGEMYWQSFYRPTKDATYTSFDEATEADARAKMLIYLIENKLIIL